MKPGDALAGSLPWPGTAVPGDPPCRGLRVEFVALTDPRAVEEAPRTPARLMGGDPFQPDAAGHRHRLGGRLGPRGRDALLLRQRRHADPLCVVHSATKHPCGRGDVMGGAVALREENAFARRPREIRITSRAFLRPFESGMILRGLRTLLIGCERIRRTPCGWRSSWPGTLR
jgi:hypothetical protein